MKRYKFLNVFILLLCASITNAQEKDALRVKVGTNITAKSQEEWHPSFGPLLGVEYERRFTPGFSLSTSLLSYSNHYGDMQDYSSFGLETQALFCPFQHNNSSLWVGLSLEGAFITFYQYSEKQLPIQVGDTEQEGVLFNYHRETFLNPYGGIVLKAILFDNKKWDLALAVHPKFHLVGERFLQCGLVDLGIQWGVKF